jgi:hypothetical protein
MLIDIEKLDNRPWVPHHIPNAIRKELYRRTLDQGFNFVDTSTGWDDNFKSFRGPLSAWVRVTSNGTGISKNKAFNNVNARERRDGFVLYGGQGFADAFGNINFNQSTAQYSPNILGYDVNGSAHTLEFSSNSPTMCTLDDGRIVPSFLPPPGIVSIEASIQKERIRKVVINWKCFNFAQLEYMTPYFMTPGISVIVEFGWNHFNVDSLLNLKDTKELTDLFADGTPLYNRIIKSNGMYDVTFGIIANFEMSSLDGMTYDCKTEIFSKHRNHTGALLNEAPKTSVSTDENGKNLILTNVSLYEFCKSRLTKITRCLDGEGKNFFDALDDGEKDKVNPLLKSKFFGGNKENRICVARQKIKDDPIGDKLKPSPNDWDYNSPDDTWVTMGFFVELLNLFLGQKIESASGSDKIDLHTFDINDVIIGGHPNLISGDGDILLIPNSKAPKFNLGWSFWIDDYKDPTTGAVNFQLAESENKFQKQKYDPLEIKSLPNAILYNTFRTGYRFSPTSKSNIGAYRDDLDAYINRFRYSKGEMRPDKSKKEAAFPQLESYKLGDKIIYAPEYWGYLKDLYININAIISTAESAKTSQEFLDGLLKKISSAVGGFWDLAVVEDEKKLKIVDKKLVSNTIFDNIFQIDISSDSFVKNMSFTTNLSNAQANQAIAGSSNNIGKDTGMAVATELPDFYFGDRLKVNEIVPDKKKSFINESSEVIKRLQKYGKTPDTYLVTLEDEGTGNDKFYKFINLALPSIPLLLTLLNAKDYVNNSNIYGGQQPNFTCELTIQGISGLRTFQCFSIKNLPRPYGPDEVIFQIVDITHTLINGDWVTNIKAAIRTTRGRPIVFSDGKEEYDSIST